MEEGARSKDVINRKDLLFSLRFAMINVKNCKGFVKNRRLYVNVGIRCKGLLTA